MKFEVSILGSNSAIPAFGRHPTSQVLNHDEQLYLIDCGEGTQMRFKSLGIKYSRIEHIFISHLHGDHIFGLIGLLTSYNLLGRQKALHIYAHIPLQESIHQQLKIGKTQLNYLLQFHPIEPDTTGILFQSNKLKVSTFPLSHKIDCNGFLFEETFKLRKFNPEKAAVFNIPKEQIPAIKEGADFVMEDGRVISNKLITEAADPCRKYAYVTDTEYLESIIPYIQGVDLLYHEATFDKSLKQRAAATKHSTSTQAGMMAKKAGVKKLIVGHFSAKYKSLEYLLNEVREVFPNAELALEEKVFAI